MIFIVATKFMEVILSSSLPLPSPSLPYFILGSFFLIFLSPYPNFLPFSGKNALKYKISGITLGVRKGWVLNS
jgi:hypothetical protein